MEIVNKNMEIVKDDSDLAILCAFFKKSGMRIDTLYSVFCIFVLMHAYSFFPVQFNLKIKSNVTA